MISQTEIIFLIREAPFVPGLTLLIAFNGKKVLNFNQLQANMEPGLSFSIRTTLRGLTLKN